MNETGLKGAHYWRQPIWTHRV